MNAFQSLSHSIPELILLASGLLVLVMDLVSHNKRVVGLFALTGLTLAALWTLTSSVTLAPSTTLDLYFGAFTVDSLSRFFKLFVYFMVGLAMMASLDYQKIQDASKASYYSLLTFMALGLILMGSSTNLLMIFLSIEFVSIISYALVCFLKYDASSNEAAIKYLLFGSMCSAIMLYGMSLVWGLTGTLELAQIKQLIATSGTPALLWAALILMTAGFGFKISMAPFHMWAPDVYQGAPTPITALLTVAPKSLGFAILLRVFGTAFPSLWSHWSSLLVFLAIVTMTVGNVIAISQTSVKRMLGYSSIAHAGYALMGLAVFSPVGVDGVLIYLVAYIFTNLGAFLTVLAISESAGTDEIQAFKGLSERSPFLALSLTVFLLSLAGIPPLAGFIGKWYVFAATIQNGFIALAVAAAINSVIAAFYYLRIVKEMYLSPADEKIKLFVPRTITLPILITLAATFLVGLWPMPWMDWVRATVAVIFPF